MKNQSTKSTPNSLTSFIKNSLPWSSSETITNINKLNPKYKHFYNMGTRQEDLVAKHSVNVQTSDDPGISGDVQIDKNYSAYMYANVDTDKAKRLLDYRVMAAYAEVADALDEICDDVLYEDENKEYIHVEFRHDMNIDRSIRKEIKKEFDKVIRYFDFENKGWEYFRSLLVDGEIFFENIIHKDHRELGILGVSQVPTELMDPIYDNVQNMIIKGHLLRRPIYNPKTNTIEKIDFIPFDRNQITYIHSGIWNEDKSLRIPFIETARRAYRQLSLIEDAIVIYRLVRAPERLVFNVDVGNMAAPKAEAYLRKLMNEYWSRKTYDGMQGSSVNAFNPQSMLDSFWFAKRQGSEGSQVTSLPGGANLGELTDLMYFVQKLYRSLRVPSNRLNPESRYEDSAQILREELKFSRFIIRLQRKFSRGVKDMFITHLKMRGLWEEYDLKENMFTIKFNEPSNFYTLREQQVLELKSTNYSNISQNPKVSETYAQKKYMEWEDNEIAENRAWLRKDAAFTFELAQIEANGPNWREQLVAADDPAEIGGAPPAGGAGAMGGSALPPFGGEAEVADTETAPEAEPAAVGDNASALPPAT
jgi:hypothetical protein